MIDTSVLEDVGLTNAQIQVYISLLELGETTTGPLIKKSNLQNSVVYNALNQLIEKGLVTFVVRGKRKYFSATNPKNLISFLEEKKRKLEELLPQLIRKQKAKESKQEAKVFLGWKGMKAAFNSIFDALPEGSDYIGFAGGAEEQFNKETQEFFKSFQKKRHEMGYKVKLIANESSRKTFEKYGYYKLFGRPEYRFVPGFAPVGVIIFGDNVMVVAFGEEPVAIIITSKQIAEVYRRFFWNMWKVANKP
jgi:sugar-specific transcriptional regulator TrmB